MRATLRSPTERTTIAAGTTVKANTAVTGTAVACSNFSKFALFLSVNSTGVSTQTLDFYVEFSPDGGTTWYRLDQAPFTDLSFEDTLTATVIYRCYHGEVLAPHVRVTHKGANCTGSNYFTIEAVLLFYN